MQVYEAIKAAYRAAPISVEAIAKRIGRSAVTLYQWAEDPDGSGRNIPASQVPSLVHHTKCYLPIAALCDACGGVFVPVECGEFSAEVMTSIGDSAREFGELVQAVAQSAADGQLTDLELAKCEREALEVQAQITATIAALRGLHKRTVGPKQTEFATLRETGI